MTAIVKPKAREIVIAARLPAFPKRHTGNPFTSEGDVTLDCGVPGCGWHAQGPRKEAKEAWEQHSRLYHSMEIGVVHLNSPSQ